MLVRIALSLALFLLPTVAAAQVGGVGRGSYVSVRGQAVSAFGAGAPVPFTGISVDWGGLQNGMIGTGTRIGLMTVNGQGSLFLGGGPQLHLALGPVLVIPALNLGTRIVAAPGGGIGGFDLTGYLSLAVAGRLGDQFFLGAEGEVPAIMDGLFFPPAFTASLVGGMYF